ncbi:MAG: TRAP transporter substrate-binding protein [Dongiaceae bacterium]
MRRTVKIAGAAAVLLMLGATAGHAATYKFDLSDEYSGDGPTGQAEAYFADLVKKNSNGQIEITVHLDGSLGYKSADHTAAVRDGAIAMASTPVDKLGGIAPIFDFQSLPFIAPSYANLKELTDICMAGYRAEEAKQNQVILFTEAWTSTGLWARKALASPADLKGLKVRAYEAIGTKTFINAGAAAIQMSWSDVVPALTTHTIDAVLTSDEGGVDAKFWELGVKYFNSIGFQQGISIVTMNKDAFNSLPADLQKVLLDAAAAADKFSWDALNGRVDKNKKVMAAAGATFVDDVPAPVIQALRDAGAPYLEEWKKKMGPKGDAILADYQAHMSH